MAKKMIEKFMKGSLIEFTGHADGYNIDEGTYKGIIKGVTMYMVDGILKLHLEISTIYESELVDLVFRDEDMDLDSMRIFPKNEALTFMLENNISL